MKQSRLDLQIVSIELKVAELVRSHVVHASLQNVTIIHDVVQDVLIRSRLVHGFFCPGEERSDSVQVEQEQNWIVRGDLEFFEDTIPDSKYLDYAGMQHSGIFVYP